MNAMATTTATTATTAMQPLAIPLTPTPYTVAIDTREQRPYLFTLPLRGLRGRYHNVQTTRLTLLQGDYSLAGLESSVAVERKSVADLFGTLGNGRARFVRELERLASYRFAAIVVESEWSTILASPPARSRLRPTTVFHSVAAWQQRYPNVHWWFVPGREFGEAVTIRLLDRFWRDTESGAVKP